MLLFFVGLLAVHWLADFVCQTHWQASNKSKDNIALARHVLSYTAILAAFAWVLVPLGIVIWAAFVIGNGVLHFVTDYFTSRWSAKHFALAITDICWIDAYTKTYGHAPGFAERSRGYPLDPGRHFHNFFVVIGFDQLIHHLTLAGTFWLAVTYGVR